MKKLSIQKVAPHYYLKAQYLRKAPAVLLGSHRAPCLGQQGFYVCFMSEKND